MLKIHTENIADLAIIECEGRIVQSAAAFQLRDAVFAQASANVIVLDLTEIYVLGGGGVGILVFLQRWAQDRKIQFKLFNPSLSTRHRLEEASSMHEFEIISLLEMTALLTQAEQHVAMAFLQGDYHRDSATM